jgi:nucleoside-triphosphatase
MMDENIYIVSAPVHSGKTTSLLRWIENRNDVSGILTPVISRKRYFMDAMSRETFPMEASPGEEEFTVGKYIFSRTAFDRAEKILENSIHQNKEWLIVDEIGPLELTGKGFDKVLRSILSSHNRDNPKTSMKLLLVVREHLLDVVIKFYGISRYRPFPYPE